MRHRTPSTWPVLPAIAALACLQGCATAPSRDPNTVALAPAASASAPVGTDASPAAARKSTVTSVTAASRAAAPKWVLNENDKTLKVALERWSQESGWRLLWELGVEYRIGAAAAVDGTFEQAISTVMHNLDRAEVPPKAIFYRGNQVVRIVARGME